MKILLKIWFVLLVTAATNIQVLAVDTVGVSLPEMYMAVITSRAKQMIDSGYYDRAINHIQQCTTYYRNNNIAPVFISEYYYVLSQAYQKKGDFKRAYDNYYNFYEDAQNIYDEGVMNNIADIKKQRVLAIETEIAEKERQSIEMKHSIEQRKIDTMIYAGMSLLVVIIILSIFVVKLIRVKRKSNNDLTQKNNQLALQQEQIKEQCDLIAKSKEAEEKANNQIISSIHYAERIQQAVIASAGDIKALFKESFVYYRPKNIVSGDFYLATKCGRFKVFVVADCTGHGIPGGFLSMLGISAVKEFLNSEEAAQNPGIVLDKLKAFVKATLNPHDGTSSMEDGMDMTICSFDFENFVMYYATANQSIIIVRNGLPIKIKGNNMPVGKYYLEAENFASLNEIILPDDMIYLYSDGFQDQLGGDLSVPVGRKLYSKNLVEYLCRMSWHDLSKQEQMLDEYMTKWRHGRDQTDDMTLVGIRIKI